MLKPGESKTTRGDHHDRRPTRAHSAAEHRARPHRLSRSTLYRKIDAGEFPRQVKISERCVGWYGSMVNKWLDQRRAENGVDVRES
ncbi:MAG: helix-turn-helix transcriptional regulator [Sphingomonas sp.]